MRLSVTHCRSTATLSYGLPYRPRSINAVTNYLSNTIDPHPSLRDDIAGFYIKHAVVKVLLCSHELEERKEECKVPLAEILTLRGMKNLHRN